MKKMRLLTRIAVRRAFALALAGVAGAGMVSDAAARVKPRMAMFASVARAAEIDPLAADSLRPTERAFVRQAADMARRQMRLAEVAVGRASGAEVRTFAQQLVADHQQISGSIDGLVQKKGVVLLPGTEATAEDYTRLSELPRADFDKEFVKLASAAQVEAVKIFEAALADAKDTDVRELAGKYLPVLRDHLNKVSELKKAFE